MIRDILDFIDEKRDDRRKKTDKNYAAEQELKLIRHNANNTWNTFIRYNLIRTLARIVSRQPLPNEINPKNYLDTISSMDITYLNELQGMGKENYSLYNTFKYQPKIYLDLLGVLYHASPVYLEEYYNLANRNYYTTLDALVYRIKEGSVTYISSCINHIERKNVPYEHVWSDKSYCLNGMFEDDYSIMDYSNKYSRPEAVKGVYRIDICGKEKDLVYGYTESTLFTEVDLLVDMTGFSRDFLLKFYRSNDGDMLKILKYFTKKYEEGSIYYNGSLHLSREMHKKFIFNKNSKFTNYTVIDNMVKTQAHKPNIQDEAQSKCHFDFNESFTPNSTINGHNPDGTYSFVGNTFGNSYTSSNAENFHKYRTPQGHGFAAEDANTLIDKLYGKNAKNIGGDNAKYGADRLVDGKLIQSKYCETGHKCISSCFKNGKMVYLKPNGSPMNIEVPKDKYDDAVKAMKNRIKNGEVQGVTNPEQATEIVTKGHLTYDQALQVAKAGNVYSIAYDSVNGAISGGIAGSVSAGIVFATSFWRGDDFKQCCKNAFEAGLTSGGVAFVTSVISSQLIKTTAVGKSLEVAAEQLLKKLSPNIVDSLGGFFGSKSKDAIKGLSKKFSKGGITFVISTLILSSRDFKDCFNGKMSGKQVAKNLGRNVASGIGATGGAALGSLYGAPVGGPVGASIGAFIGFIYGYHMSKSAKGIYDETVGKWVDDDSVLVNNITENVLADKAEVFLLSESEFIIAVQDFARTVPAFYVKDVFASSNRYAYVSQLVEPIMRKVTSNRMSIDTSNLDLIETLNEIITA